MLRRAIRADHGPLIKYIYVSIHLKTVYITLLENINLLDCMTEQFLYTQHAILQNDRQLVYST